MSVLTHRRVSGLTLLAATAVSATFQVAFTAALAMAVPR